MALFPKGLVTHGLIKETLGSRGVRLETRGLIGSTDLTEAPLAILHGLLGIYHTYIAKYMKKHRTKGV